MTDRVIVRNDGSRVVVRALGPTGDSAALVAPLAHATSHHDGGTDDLYDPADISSTVIEPFNHLFIATSLTMTSQRAYLMPFRARATRTISNLFSRSGGTAASGLSLARMGLYTVDSSTNVATLVARTASDTTLWASTFTTYARALATAGGYPASYAVTRGSWYAFGVIAVGTTMPGLRCTVASQYPSAATTRLRVAPGNFQSSQADLWTSVDIDSLSADSSGVYVGAY